MYINNIISSDTVNTISTKLGSYTDRFVSNGPVASLITVALFIVLCIIINNNANK